MAIYSLPLAPGHEGQQGNGKHYIDVQIGPYMHTTIKARWEILLENFHFPHSFLLYN